MTYYMVSYYMVSYYAILRNITFLTFNNVKKNKHLITLDNVKELCQRYINVQTQTQRSPALSSTQGKGGEEPVNSLTS